MKSFEISFAAVWKHFYNVFNNDNAERDLRYLLPPFNRDSSTQTDLLEEIQKNMGDDIEFSISTHRDFNRFMAIALLKLSPITAAEFFPKLLSDPIWLFSHQIQRTLIVVVRHHLEENHKNGPISVNLLFRILIPFAYTSSGEESVWFKSNRQALSYTPPSLLYQLWTTVLWRYGKTLDLLKIGSYSLPYSQVQKYFPISSNLTSLDQYFQDGAKIHHKSSGIVSRSKSSVSIWNPAITTLHNTSDDQKEKPVDIATHFAFFLKFSTSW